VVDTVEILKGSFLTDEEYFKAAVLGWGVELVSRVLAHERSVRVPRVFGPSVLWLLPVPRLRPSARSLFFGHC
jgi:farnesyl diphosphate synthase